MIDPKPLRELEEAMAAGTRRPLGRKHPPLGPALASPFLPGDAYEDVESYPGWFIGSLFVLISVALCVAATVRPEPLPTALSDLLPGDPWAGSAIFGAAVGVLCSVPLYFVCGGATTIALRLAGLADASWVLGRHLSTLTLLPYAALAMVGWAVLAATWESPTAAAQGMSWEAVFELAGTLWTSGLGVYAAIVTFELRWWRATLVLAILPMALATGATWLSMRQRAEQVASPPISAGANADSGAAVSNERVADTGTPAATERPRVLHTGPLHLRLPAGWKQQKLPRPALRIDDAAGHAALATAKAPATTRLRSPLGGASIDVLVWSIPGATSEPLADARTALQKAMAAAAREGAEATNDAPKQPPAAARWPSEAATPLTMDATYADRAERRISVHALGPHGEHVAIVVVSVARADADRLRAALDSLRSSVVWQATP